jgi:hypothetical protein
MDFWDCFGDNIIRLSCSLLLLRSPIRTKVGGTDHCDKATDSTEFNPFMVGLEHQPRLCCIPIVARESISSLPKAGD